jgi:hypothetical protein
MKDNDLLMIILAFVSGFMLHGMMKNMCGGRLVEGDTAECDEACQASTEAGCNPACQATMRLEHSCTADYECDPRYYCGEYIGSGVCTLGTRSSWTPKKSMAEYMQDII